MKVRMYPHPDELDTDSSGIAQVVINYCNNLHKYGINIVGPEATSYDLEAAHAAAHPGAEVNHCHGILWTAEKEYTDYGYGINKELVESFKTAKEITVPSEWVAKTFWRDMRRKPHIVPHGVNWDAWQHDRPNEGYVLWGKNRTSDGLDPTAINAIATAFPDTEFVTTFAAPGAPSNVTVIGHAIPHHEMMVIIQSASVLLAPDRETWGIQHAEAMASGVPVLTVDAGAVPDFMPHGVAGYCFQPANVQDAVNGLAYCIAYRDQLGENGRELAREMSWDVVCETIAEIYRMAYQEEPASVSVIIPCYNYGHFLDKAIGSVVNQSYRMIEHIIVVNDGSNDGSEQVAQEWVNRDARVILLNQENQGVAAARNAGLQMVDSKYVAFLDADDRMEPRFIESLVSVIEQQRNLGIVYTGVRVPLQDGTEVVPWDWPYAVERGEVKSQRIWPKPFSYEEQMQRSNQVPSCCLIRRKALLQVGGYRSRYCPIGAGSEDAEMFLRIGKFGWDILFVGSTAHSLWVHNHIEGISSGRYGESYDEPDWTAWHPETKDGKHPFASIAQPLNGLSHPVHSYDDPLVSVVIPVGPGHEESVIDSLDSLEAQTFRGWEAIVVWDSPNPPSRLVRDAYPYVNWQMLMPGGNGAGVARNIGASVANGPLLAFLDADDYYHANFLERTVNTFIGSNSVVYTDFVSVLPPGTEKQPGMEYMSTKENGGIVAASRSGHFDNDLAFTRPEGSKPYTWASVTVLLPKVWHDDIAGFDEEMESWEDCDYLLRLAWIGCPFTHIEEPLWIYDFTSGKRRRDSAGAEPALMKYMQKKYDKIVE